MSASEVGSAPHAHLWRIAEVEFDDYHSVDRYECCCGAIDYAYIA